MSIRERMVSATARAAACDPPAVAEQVPSVPPAIPHEPDSVDAAASEQVESVTPAGPHEPDLRTVLDLWLERWEDRIPTPAVQEIVADMKATIRPTAAAPLREPPIPLERLARLEEAEKILLAFHGDDWLEKLRSAYDGTYT
jgi:hypothetical protein